MPNWTRVRDKETGHHYSVAVVDSERHEVLKQDATDRHGRPLPAKLKTTVDQAAASDDTKTTKGK